MSKQGPSNFIDRQLGNPPLSAKLLFLALGPLALTLAVTLVLIIVSVTQLEDRTSTARLQEEVKIVNQQVAQFEANLNTRANTLVSDPALLDAVQRGDQTALQTILLSANVRSDLSHLQVVNLQGQTLALAQSFVMDTTPAQLGRLHSLGLLEIQAVELVPTPQGWLLAVVRPVKTSKGLVGALTVGRLVDTTIQSAWNFGRTDPLLTIYDAQGNLQPVSGAGEPGQPARPAVNQTLWAQAQSGQEVSSYTQIEGRQYRIAYAPLKVGGKTAAVYSVALLSTAAAVRDQLVMASLLTASFSAVLGGLFALFMGRRFILRPILALVASAERITAGHLDTVVPETAYQDEVGRLTRAFSSMTTRLRQTLTNLEKGTADLARRSTQLETAAQVARDAAAIHDVEQLLDQTARLISDRFGFYHTGIFLLDEEGQFAILRAASSEGGRRMLERGHQLAVGKVGIVGRAAASGETRVALDVGADAAFFDNPDLPDTRSEMALPLVVRGKIIGVLDVQSTQEAAFSRDDVAVLQTMADQVAVAIDNARLLSEAQAALEAARRAYGELGQQAWTELLSSRKEWGYRYTRKSVTPTKGDWHTEMLQAIQSGASVHETDTGEPTLAVPLKVRDQVVGALRFRKGAEGGEWLPDEISQLQTLTEQLGVALDSARLYQDTQRRAAREQLTAAVTARMRETLDIDTVLQTAVREISAALGLVALDVHLGTEAETIQDSVPSLSKQ